uniref:Uncharacterized protein n=1 Tax=viral metagenome TaxID=1070528 RepID=A0A6C0IGH4_9ZZZZ
MIDLYIGLLVTAIICSIYTLIYNIYIAIGTSHNEEL